MIQLIFFYNFTQLREDSDYICMQETLLTFLLHIKKLITHIITHIGGSHPVATGCFLAFCVVYLGY